MKIKNNKSLHHRYQILSKVGQGNFGSVYLVRSYLDNQKYIMKKLRLDRTQSTRETILKEVKLMKSLSHCYVIRYLESFLEDNKVCIVMQYAAKGDLQRYLHKRSEQELPLTEQEIIQWLIQLCLGLKYIHEKRIVHRDLKMDNIFINEQNQLKIGDFGISKIMQETFDMAKTKIGTPFVMAPQIWNDMKYNQKSDVWSLGCILYKLMTYKYPFIATNPLSFVKKITFGLIEPINGDYSTELKQLAYQLLKLEPQERPSVQKILQKPFIKKHLNQILQTTINRHDSKIISTKFSKKHSSHRPSLAQRRSLSSLTNLISPKPETMIQNIKVIEFKQNYPIVLSENKYLKKQITQLKQQKENFEHKSQQLLTKIINSQYNKEQIIDLFRNHVLSYVYP